MVDLVHYRVLESLRREVNAVEDYRFHAAPTPQIEPGQCEQVVSADVQVERRLYIRSPFRREGELGKIASRTARTPTAALGSKLTVSIDSKVRWPLSREEGMRYEQEQPRSLPQVLFQFKGWPGGVIVGGNRNPIEEGCAHLFMTISINNQQPSEL